MLYQHQQKTSTQSKDSTHQKWMTAPQEHSRKQITDFIGLYD